MRETWDTDPSIQAGAVGLWALQVQKHVEYSGGLWGVVHWFGGRVWARLCGHSLHSGGTEVSEAAVCKLGLYKGYTRAV